MASTSGSFSLSAEMTRLMTWISLRKPLGKSGRIGRSMSRQVSVSFSSGRPSRLKKPPGILPPAYARSRYSTVSGRKSRPSMGVLVKTTVDSTMVPPQRTTTAPSACLATLPGLDGEGGAADGCLDSVSSYAY